MAYSAFSLVAGGVVEAILTAFMYSLTLVAAIKHGIHVLEVV